MLSAIVEGNSSPEVLEGRIRPHHQFILAQLLGLIDDIDKTIAQFDREIEDYCRPFAEAVELVDSQEKNNGDRPHSVLIIKGTLHASATPG